MLKKFIHKSYYKLTAGAKSSFMKFSIGLMFEIRKHEDSVMMTDNTEMVCAPEPA